MREGIYAKETRIVRAATRIFVSRQIQEELEANKRARARARKNFLSTCSSEVSKYYESNREIATILIIVIRVFLILAAFIEYITARLIMKNKIAVREIRKASRIS